MQELTINVRWEKINTWTKPLWELWLADSKLGKTLSSYLASIQQTEDGKYSWEVCVKYAEKTGICDTFEDAQKAVEEIFGIEQTK